LCASVARRRQSKKFTEGWIDVNEQHLARAVEHFGAARKLASITVQDVVAWSVKLQDAGVKAGTVLHHLHALSNLFKRAQVLRQPETSTHACDDTRAYLSMMAEDGMVTPRPESIPKQLPLRWCRHC
jgi:hypothetical protein